MAAVVSEAELDAFSAAVDRRYQRSTREIAVEAKLAILAEQPPGGAVTRLSLTAGS